MAEARIGPNAIIRVGEALAAMQGRSLVADVFAAAGLSAALAVPPRAMVPEADVTRLHGVMRGLLGVAAARRVGAEAGVRWPLVLLLP